VISRAKISAVLLAAATVAACAGGCGGGHSSAISTAQFVKRANAICEREHLAMIGDSDAYTRRHRDSKLSSGQLHLAANAAVLPARMRNDVRLLRGLGMPEGDEQSLTEFFAAEERAIETEPNVRPTSLTQLLARYRRPERMATTYGIPVCVGL
jgi:hypothetical protein